MRILWVEDNEQLPETLIAAWFGEFYRQHHIERRNGFAEAYRCILEQTRNYDCVILDIDLKEGGFNPEEFKDSEIAWPEEGDKNPEKYDDFLKEAGFHLYIQLLYKGFPRKRITFLTGNAGNRDSSRADLIGQFKQAFAGDDEAFYQDYAYRIAENLPKPLRAKFDNLLKNASFDDIYTWLEQWALPAAIPGEPINANTYKDLEDRFHAARMNLPAPIEKGEYTAPVLQAWLGQHCSPTSNKRDEFDYLTLRRGILDVLADIEKDGNIQFTAAFQNDLDKQTFLSGLIWQVRDFALPPGDYERSYLALCDYLSKPFDGYTWNGGNNAKNSNPLLKERERHLKIPLYFLRNWIAHGLIAGNETKITAQAAGIAFLLAIRHFFNVEKYGFQNELQRLFAKPVTEPEKWKQLCIAIGRKHGVRNADDGLEKLRAFGFKKSAGWDKQDFVQNFYAAYLLCLQQADGTVQNTPFTAWVAGEIR